MKQGGIAVLAIVPMRLPLHAALGPLVHPPVAQMLVIPAFELADGSLMIKHDEAEHVGQLCLN